MVLRQNVIEAFQQHYNFPPDFIAHAPGRVNLLGEHVDYNDGFVLPVAIDRATYIAFRGSNTGISRVTALDLSAEATFDLRSITEKKDTTGASLPDWACYPAGMLWSLAAAGLYTPGMEAVFTSDVPPGAGLSSSASVQMAFAMGWQMLGEWKLEPIQLALLGQRAENEYVGLNCGIMDQFSSTCGVENCALFLDCRSLSWRSLRLPEQVSLVLANTMVQRSLTDSTYNARRLACTEAVRILKSVLPEIKALRDVSMKEFDQHVKLLPETIAKKARYVVEEIDRTQAAAQMLEAGDAAHFGQLMNECHIGLRDLYEVSCPELDAMVEIAWSLPGCYGARLTGAGFGGCTVNLVDSKAADTFAQELSSRYLKRTTLRPEIYICHASGGAAAQTIKALQE